MIQYIIEYIAFQLVFLVIYDFYLKRETFFQWNRVYLISTYMLSLLLPWIKIEAFKTSVPETFAGYPDYLWEINNAAFTATIKNSQFSFSWQENLLYGGMLVAALLFGYKMLQLYRLRRKGEIHYFKDFTQIVIANSNIAFSFFRSIFLGDRVLHSEHKSIIAHELVHIKQKHTYDLLFFELMRIVGWFNPLVYVYQSRVSELHEFIADAQVAKTNKEEQYQLLLSQVFQTQNISFINQFYKSSLIKKRIVMLQKSKSNSIWKLKYLALVPMLVGMMLYTSCETDVDQQNGLEHSGADTNVTDIENLTEQEVVEIGKKLLQLSAGDTEWTYRVKDQNSTVTFTKGTEGSFISSISGPEGFPIKAKMNIDSKILKKDFDFFEKFKRHTFNSVTAVPFAGVEEVPIFPGCEGADDKRACFQQMMQKHISKNFNYPQEAQDKGIQGRVSVLFTIGNDGVISGIEQRGPDKILEEEVHRIISKLPNMIPGRQKGNAVAVPFSIPISFKLQSQEYSKEEVSISKKDEKGKTNSFSYSPPAKFTLNPQEPEPLIILNGREVSKEARNSISPNDIESVNVLKGESAINIYGERGKNGVILIQTK